MWAPNAWAVGALVVVAGCDVVFGLERPKPAPGAWERVTAGRHHTCGLKVDGTLWCWGDNGYGQTGGGQMVPFLEVPTQIGEATWIDVASQDDHTCGIQTDGTLWCWGLNGQAQCGTHYEQNEGRLFVPTLVDAGSWSAVATGFEHSCAIRTDGSLWCWGEGVYGQLGDGSDLRRSMPTRAAGEAWTTISLGFDHTCGLQGDKLWCFGSNFQGQLADPTVGDRMLPNLVEGTWDEVAAGDGFTCARRDGQVMCWGVNDEGQLGNGTTRNSKIGSALGGGASNWSAIAAGRTHACGLRDGSLWCWGSSAHGEIASDEVGIVASLPLPILDPNLPWTRLALGYAHTCVIDDDHRLYCGGTNGLDELGQGSARPRGAPARVEGTWTQVGLGDAFSCALDDQGAVSCWGRNDHFQLGDGTNAAQQAPNVVPRIASAVTQLVVGTQTSCARGEAKDLRYCWGLNQFAEVGDPSSDPPNAAAQVPRKIPDTWFPASMTTHACGFDGDRRAGCWGENFTGAVGVGTTMSPQATPTSLTTNPPLDTVVVGGAHSCGLAAGAVLCWGQGDSGQIGNGSTNPVLVPTPIGIAAVDLALGDRHTCAIDANGVARCWGRGYEGQLGTGGLIAEDYPVPLGGSWRQLSGGEQHTCGIALDGTLWCWGSNDRGSVGDGTFLDRLTPVQIDPRTDWQRVVAGSFHTCALASGGALWCWGDNSNGELGTNNSWRRELLRVPD